MKNKKGFTLIELLAVIIILGILMIIAIPSVTQYINNSRKSAYVDTAKEIVSGARNRVNQGDLEMFSTDTTYYIPIRCIGTENGAKSPYGDFDQAYVLVTYDGHGYKYYWVSRDETGQGVKDPILVTDLDENDIDSDIEFDYIKTNVTKDGTTKVAVLEADNCKEFEEEKTAAETILATSQTAGQLNQIPDTNIYIFKGADPDNYVTFNGESWRIIGIYDGQLKIQRVATIANQYFDNTSPYSNVWADSDIKTYLNTTYYSTITDTTVKNMIDATAEWNVGKAAYNAVANDAYTSATGTKWKGTDTTDPGIGLMASYEFLYASGGDSCLTTSGYDYYSSCGTATYDWMKPGSLSWSLSGDSGSSDRSLFVGSDGGVYRSGVGNGNAVAPAVFLKPSVKLVDDGKTGTSPSDAYNLILE